MARAVISTIGQDKPGIVDALAERVSKLGVNIDDSRMALLGGEFAVLMAVSGSTADLSALDAALAQYAEDEGFAYLYRPTEARAPAPNLPATVNVVAMDHPGIVHGVARFFSSRNINIRDLDTESVPAAHTGTPIFNLTMTIEVPAGVRIGQLRAEFEAYCDGEGLDGTVVAG
ncbi:MAG: glycine cleavage system protein R [Pseudomonadales bacterium]